MSCMGKYCERKNFTVVVGTQRKARKEGRDGENDVGRKNKEEEITMKERRKLWTTERNKAKRKWKIYRECEKKER